MTTHSLWDVLPRELQEIIFEKSVDLCREEYLAQGRAKHERNKKKLGRSVLTADLMRYVLTHTDAIELINWGFPVELRELEAHVNPPVELLDDVNDYDYSTYYDAFIHRCIAFVEDPANADEWATPTDDAWLTMYTKLVEFKQKYGHLNVLSEGDGHPSLHLWLEYMKDEDTPLSRQKRYSLRTLGVRLPKQPRVNF